MHRAAQKPCFGEKSEHLSHTTPSSGRDPSFLLGALLSASGEAFVISYYHGVLGMRVYVLVIFPVHIKKKWSPMLLLPRH